MTEKAHIDVKLMKAIQGSLALFGKLKNPRKAMGRILPILGKALSADRAYFFSVSLDSHGQLKQSSFPEWDKVPQPVSSEGSYSSEEISVLDFIGQRLLDNLPCIGLTRDAANEDLVKWLKNRGALAYLFLPVHLKNNRLWGFFGFENHTSEVSVAKEQVEALRSFSNTLGIFYQLKRSSRQAKRKSMEFGQLISNVQDVVFKLDDEVHFTFLGGTWLQMTGFAKESCIGKPLKNFLEFQEGEKLVSMIKSDEFDPEGCISFYTSLVRSDDSLHHIRLNLKKVRKGSKTEFIGTVISVHQLQLELQALKEREKRFSSLVENVEDVLYSLEIDTGQVIFISDRIEKFGFRKKEFYDDPQFWWKQIVLEDRLEVLQAFSKFLKNRVPSYEIEYRIQKPDGKIVWINDKFGIETDADKIPFRIHGRISEVTEQKNKEIQLEQTENRFRIITENLPFPFILSMEEDFSLIYYNFSFHEHFQMRTGERAVFGHTWIDQLVAPDSKEFFESFLKQNVNFSNYEVLLQTSEGPQWYSLSSQSIPYKMGFARAIVFYNINKRKLSELEVIRMNDLIQAVNQTQMDFSMDEEIQDAFHRLLENLMVFSESFVGFLAEFFPDERGIPRLKPNAAINFPWHEELLVGNEKIPVEGSETLRDEVFFQWIVTHKKTLISNELAKDPRLDVEKSNLLQAVPLERFLGIPIFKGGRLVGLVGLGNKEKPYSHEDVDFLKPFLSSFANLIASLHINGEKRKAEILHKESESLYRLLSENIDDIVTLHDLEMKTIYASPSLEKVTGFAVEGFLGRDFFEFFDFKPLDEPDFTKFPRFVIPLRHGVTGKEIKLEMLWKPIYTEDGELASFLAASRDVTERELILDELKKTLEKEIELNQLKSKFITMTSHELRTPLATIQSSADLMEIFTEAVQDERAHEGLIKQIRKIHVQLSRLSQMISDVMLFEKNNEGKLVYNQAEVEIKSLILQLVYNQFAPQVNEAKIDLDLGTKEVMIQSDPNLLFHVLRNLIENALKYTPEGRPRPELKLMACDKDVKIILKDHGIGIPQEELKFVFDTFFRASNVKNIKGTGLGLSIVNDLVKMLGGKLSFTSEENKGSVFTVILPYERYHSLD
jgi:PAS domain S-box-containing protein